MRYFLLLAALPQAALAAQILDPARLPSPGPGKEVAVAPKQLDSYTADTKLLYESFAGENRSTPNMSNETSQTIRVTKLPDKEGLARSELLYKQFLSVSRVQLPGALRPFESKQDLGAYLFDKPLKIKQRSGGEAELENLAEVKAAAEKSARDPIARQGLKAALSPEATQALTAAASPSHPCLASLVGKGAGEAWEASRRVGGVGFTFRCEFVGWGEALGQRVELVKYSSAKTKAARTQPNGAIGVVEAGTEGLLAIEPKSGEQALRQTTELLAEPTEKEIAARKKAGSEIPRATGFVRSSVHLYPI